MLGSFCLEKWALSMVRLFGLINRKDGFDSRSVRHSSFIKKETPIGVSRALGKDLISRARPPDNFHCQSHYSR